MHNYYELINHGVNFNLKALDEQYSKAMKLINKNPNRSNVMALQMVNLQKAIIAIGIFSMFESQLQDYFNNNDKIKREYPESCKIKFTKSFNTLKSILESNKQEDLLSNFEIYKNAINTLKHGFGSSYKRLLKIENLPFNIKKENKCFFQEGNVDEVNSLIEVDNEFVLDCSLLLRDISLYLFENFNAI